MIGIYSCFRHGITLTAALSVPRGCGLSVAWAAIMPKP